MNFKATFAAAAILVGASGAASAAVINFDSSGGTGLVNGERVTTIQTVDGLVTANVTANRREGGPLLVGVARTYDTTVSGADGDIEPPYRDLSDTVLASQPVLGNVLIVDESTSTAPVIGNPNDNGRGGLITFDFTRSVLFSGLTWIDDGSIVVTGFLDGIFVDSTVIDNLGVENALQTFAAATPWLVDSVVFDLGSDSGAIDNVLVSAVPLPAGGVLLLTALGGIAAARRRKAA